MKIFGANALNETPLFQSSCKAEPHRQEEHLECFKVLLLDDDDDELIFFREACKMVKTPVAITHLKYPSGLMDTLRKENFDALFLDMMMPLNSGIECLQTLRRHEEFQKLPVFVFSGNEYHRQIEKSYQLGIRRYFIKPHTIADLIVMLQQLFNELAMEPAVTRS